MEDPSGAREPRARPREQDPGRRPHPDQGRTHDRPRDRPGDPRRKRSSDGNRRRDRDRDPERDQERDRNRDRNRDRERERERERDPDRGPRRDTHRDAGPRAVNPLRRDICPRPPGLDERRWNITSQRQKDSWNATNANTCALGEVWCR
ncbi:MARVELD3 isoform 3 [Pan troglodytes]|uniref:MARVELD3 isoform 3 n=1 Tax=Pan troglodytes TaxID=9598 RepID=A0A2J8K9Y9_PANTR|nr:MARVELD3 isoform 3 [Pan troglodytes]